MKDICDLIISCAGIGSRMQVISSEIHKSLIPYKNAPILYHLVSQVPDELKIGILLGYKAGQIKDFLELAFPKKEMEFIYVDDYSSGAAGTAVSLLQAEGHVKNNFWYLPCDAFFDEILPSILTSNPTQTTLFVSELNTVENPEDYTTIDADNDGALNGLVFKLDYSTLKNPQIFTGLMFVYEAPLFFKELRSNGYQEFVSAFQKNTKNIACIQVKGWRDMGTPIEYKKHVALTAEYDFSKPHEKTYVLSNIIIKFISDDKEIKRKLIKPKNNPVAYPNNVQTKGNFISYSKVQGQTLYEFGNKDIFVSLLEWLSLNVWKTQNQDITSDLRTFYMDKTLLRVKNIREKLPYSFKDSHIINEHIKIVPIDVIESINWSSLCTDGIASEIHGDLQFDNIIFDENGRFRLIDWRTSFGEQTRVGDLYYDLGKLLGGIRMDYSQIKKGNFAFHSSGKHHSFSFASCTNAPNLEKEFNQFCIKHQYDLERIRTLVALIYLNMSPLHTRPFSDLLFFHSLVLISELQNHE
jgi:NDP-sugar pyrophosphorylase family protein